MLRYGLVLERIHRAIEFNQMDWMKPYIDFKTKGLQQPTILKKISLN